MWFLEAGAQTPAVFRPSYYRQAHEFDFVIAGDLAIQTQAAPADHSSVVALKKYFFVERPAMGIVGLAQSPASRTGAVWLQVTYAKGAHWSESPTPIESPNYL